MNESTYEIEHLVDYHDIKGADDLTCQQRRLIISKFIQEQSTFDLLENLIDRHPPDGLPKIITELYFEKDNDQLLLIAKKLQKIARNQLDHHFDDKINDVISDHRWSKFEDKLDRMNSDRREVALLDNETPYGPKFTLGKI